MPNASSSVASPVTSKASASPDSCLDNGVFFMTQSPSLRGPTPRAVTVMTLGLQRSSISALPVVTRLLRSFPP